MQNCIRLMCTHILKWINLVTVYVVIFQLHVCSILPEYRKGTKDLRKIIRFCHLKQSLNFSSLRITPDPHLICQDRFYAALKGQGIGAASGAAKLWQGPCARPTSQSPGRLHTLPTQKHRCWREKCVTSSSHSYSISTQMLVKSVILQIVKITVSTAFKLWFLKIKKNPLIWYFTF